MKLKRLWCRHQLNEKIQDDAIYTSKNYKNGTEFKMAKFLNDRESCGFCIFSEEDGRCSGRGRGRCEVGQLEWLKQEARV